MKIEEFDIMSDVRVIPNSEEYRVNWDKVFGKPQKGLPCEKCTTRKMQDEMPKIDCLPDTSTMQQIEKMRKYQEYMEYEQRKHLC